MRWIRKGLLTGALLSIATASPVAAAAVDAELVLAVDISGSVDEDEARLQRQGYVRALTDPRVIATIESGRIGRVAMTYVEWAGEHYQQVIAPWTIVDGPESAARFAAVIAAAPILSEVWTSISAMLDFGVRLLARSPFRGRRQIIDISGDGANNAGDIVTAARDRAVGRGVTINGLAIINGRISRYGSAPIVDLDDYFRDCVIGGAGRFLIVANGYQDYARAIRRKLILEIAGRRPPPPARLIAAAAAKRDCLAGEHRRQDLMDEY